MATQQVLYTPARFRDLGYYWWSSGEYELLMSPTGAQENGRTAMIARSADKPLGACIYLTAAELRDLGIQPDSVMTIQYNIDDSMVHVSDE